ncbi:MAG: hypothetical protein KAJ64_00965, partial [Thermoplasmata archaeon]|nr:hypothetical protein [Thermoplasmata archaeon]
DWAGENDDGYVHGILFLGGYIYPMGHDIFHDPSYVSNALFLDIGVNLDPLNVLGSLIGLYIMAGIVVGVVVLSVMTIKKTSTPKW